MAISIYLAASPAQISKMERFPEKLAWMACHFSPYGTGLSNLPASLPPLSPQPLQSLLLSRHIVFPATRRKAGLFPLFFQKID